MDDVAENARSLFRRAWKARFKSEPPGDYDFSDPVVRAGVFAGILGYFVERMERENEAHE